MREEKKIYLPWVVWLCAAIFYGYQFCLRVSPSVMTADLMTAFQVDSCALGTSCAFYYFSYVLLQIPAGSLLDKFGPRRVILTAILLCGFGTTLFAFTPSLWLASLGRLLIGAGSAFAFLGAVKIGTVWFPLNKLSFVIGCTIFIGTSGAVGGGLPLSLAVSYFGWRSAMALLALLTLGIFLFSFVFLKDVPVGSDKKVPEPSKACSIGEGILIILKNPQSWVLGIYGILMYVPLAVFADLWGVPFLKEVYHLDEMKAPGFVSLIYVGMGICAPLAYLALRFFKSYRKCLLFSSVLSTILFVLLYFYGGSSEILLGLLLFGIGCALGGQFLAFPVVCEVNPSHLSATASGVQNMICMCSGLIFQPTVGWLLELTGASGGGRNYLLALSVVPVSTLLSCFLFFFIRETYQLEQKKS
jgi:sugar phosphate permease